MKKMTVISLALIMIISLVACSASTNGSPINGDVQKNTDFSIVGAWKNVGETTHNQIQPGAIISFDGKNCNVFSPKDTYALYKDSGKYRLDCTSILGGTISYTVEIIDNDNIHLITPINTVIKLKRVG